MLHSSVLQASCQHNWLLSLLLVCVSFWCLHLYTQVFGCQLRKYRDWLFLVLLTEYTLIELAFDIVSLFTPCYIFGQTVIHVDLQILPTNKVGSLVIEERDALT